MFGAVVVVSACDVCCCSLIFEKRMFCLDRLLQHWRHPSSILFRYSIREARDGDVEFDARGHGHGHDHDDVYG